MSAFNKFVLFSFIVALTNSPAYSQNNPYGEVSIASPTAASLGKYADIPVSYHTGIPQIGIPIYTVKEGPLQLPITLSYHAGGTRVLETASWVGTGWSLNAGGVITRTVQGAPDERGTSTVDGQIYGHLSDSGYNNYVMRNDPNFPIGVTFDDPQFAQGKFDGEPDLFFFNFGGHSGKFYFHDDGTPVIVPAQDIKIEYNYTGVGSIQSFILTTSEGTKYHFGKTASTTDVDPIERTNTFNEDAGLVTGTVISSWYLNKVTSFDEMFSINLSYLAENYSYYTISMFPVKHDNQSDQDSANDYEYSLIKNFINGVRLSQISFSGGQVEFIGNSTRADLNGLTQSFVDDVNTQAKCLDSIRVSGSSGFCKKFIFSYDYFVDSVSALPGYFSSWSMNIDRKRLKLQSLKELSCDSTVVIPAHVFEYFPETPPRRLSFSQDHWGFNNGVATNTTLIPTYTVNDLTIVPGANRDASWPAMRSGTLKKITYPTGGFSEFEFEPHYTWVDFPVNEWNDAFDLSAGYDGSSNPVTQFKNFSGSTYKLSFSNSSQGSQALLNIYNSSNVNVAGWVLEPGSSTQQTLNLTSGTYRIVLQKLSAVTGNGTFASFDELVTDTVRKNDTVGGLRIKTLTHNDAATTTHVVTSYTYEVEGKSTGILYSRPTYVQVTRNDIVREAGFFTTDPDATPYCSPNGCFSCEQFNGVPLPMAYYKSPSGIRPMETTQGNHIGYNEVKVRQTGNGFTIYRYFGSERFDTVKTDVAVRNVDIQTCSISIPNFPHAPVPHDFKRGELKYEGHFNEAGQLLKDIKYNCVYEENPITTPAYIVVTQPWYTGTFYQLKTAKKIRDTVVQTVYSNGSGLSTTTLRYYGSSYHNQVTEQRTLGSEADTSITRSKYALDFRIANCDTISNCYNQYQSAWISATVQYETQKGACTTHYCRYWAFNEYRKNLAIARNAYIDCRGSYLAGSSGFNQCLVNAKNSADSQLKPILELQNIFKNAPIEITGWKDNKLLSASFTNFTYGTNPSTKVYPGKVRLVQLSAPSSTFTFASSNGNSITADNRYVDESTARFHQGNLASVTQRGGTLISYIWDYQNTLPIAAIANASDTNCAYTSFESNGTGNWTISSMTRDISGGITGKLSYQLSNGNISKSNLVSSTEYILTYWTKNSSAFSIAGTQGIPIQGRNVGDWRLFMHKITGITQISIEGTGHIDELRLYPKGAQLKTYTYDPMLGLTSECDVANKIIYYEYDAFGRLKLIRDQDKNILKTFDYKFQANTNQ